MNSAEELYAEAKELFQPAMSEVRRRTLASRAYYAGYHFLLEQRLEPPEQETKEIRTQEPKLGSHGIFHRWLGMSDDRNIRRAGVLLSQMYHHRIKADYKLAARLSQADVTDAMELLKELVEETLI